MDPKSPQGRLVVLAERQWGVVSVAQLYALGFSPDHINAMVRRGQLHRLYTGVYAVGHRKLPFRGRLFAAQLAAGDGAFLSHRTAAADRKLRPNYDFSRIELTVAASSTPKKRRGLVVHRTTTPIDRAEARPHNGLLVATVPRILVDSAAVEQPREIQRLITEAVHKQAFDPKAVQAAIDRHAHRPGIRVLRAAFTRYDPAATDRKSDLERSFQCYQRSDPNLPVPEYNVYEGPWEIDVAWRARGLALELDGRPYHIAMQDSDRDRRKDRALTIAGWTVVRVSDFEWEYDRAAVIADLYALLGISARR